MKKLNESSSSFGRLLKVNTKTYQISSIFCIDTSQFRKNTFQFLVFLIPLFSLLILPDIANAGTGGAAQFQTMANTISGYINGLPALILLLCGLFYSIFLLTTKHTIIPLGMVILAAIIASAGPAMITGLVSALI
jgi:hypothetical protein